MKIVERNYVHYLNNHVDIDIDICNKQTYSLYFVYFINCLVNNNYFSWLLSQVDIVYKYSASIYIIATINKTEEEDFKNKILSIYPNVIIEFNYENEYEYRGILKVWELGQLHKSKNDLILYFHSKGMTHNTHYESNRNDCYNIILKDIGKIKEIFDIFPSIDKVGWFSGGLGWIWYNFWYARGSYINSVEKPIKTQRRHYYEDWLCRKISNNDYECNEIERPFTYYKNTLQNCYGFYCDENIGNIGSYYCADTNSFLLCEY